MKYISFSLWGDKPIYNVGIIRNAELWKQIYPSWQMIVYYDNSVPKETIDKLIELDVKCVLFDNSVYGMFWRFFAIDAENCEYAIFRDADSRISLRESLAVDEWIKSGKSLHVMRDHPAHRIPAGNDSLGILGGMWGIKNNVIPITTMINNFTKSKEHNYGNDQAFLKLVYSVLENDRCTHDDFFENKPFPIKREPGRFVGERIDEFENYVGEDYKAVL
jgi:hypothetical protein